MSLFGLALGHSLNAKLHQLKKGLSLSSGNAKLFASWNKFQKVTI